MLHGPAAPYSRLPCSEQQWKTQEEANAQTWRRMAGLKWVGWDGQFSWVSGQLVSNAASCVVDYS